MALSNIKSSFKLSERFIFFLLAANFLARLAIMLLTNLGNDEVYYVQYALHPGISHFDHPPLVGLLIRLSTFNLHFIYNDFFVRLGALLVGSVNLYLIYRIGVLLKDKSLGLIAALLGSSSFYISVIAGTFILPDTPMSLFWLMAIWSFIRFTSQEKTSGYWLILFGIAVGFGLLAKYQALFLWFGAMIYLLRYERKILLTPQFWLSVVSTAVIFSPILYWNFTSNYSGFNYHSGRVGSSSWVPSLNYFFPEFFGQIFYNNPFNFALIIFSLYHLFKSRLAKMDRRIFFLLAISFPLILTTLTMSLYNRTLPHWSGPSYFALLLIAGYCITKPDFKLKGKLVKKLLLIGTAFFYLIVGAGLLQIKTSFLSLSKSKEVEKVGKNDFTVDLGLWKVIATEITSTVEKDKVSNPTSTFGKYIITHNWFPAGHLDYYYALQNDCKLYIMGDYKKQHEYLRINTLRGDIPLHSDVYYITTSNYYQAPNQRLLEKFEVTEAPEIIPIKIKDKTVVNLFIFRLTNLKEPISMVTEID